MEKQRIWLKPFNNLIINCHGLKAVAIQVKGCKALAKYWFSTCTFSSALLKSLILRSSLPIYQYAIFYVIQCMLLASDQKKVLINLSDIYSFILILLVPSFFSEISCTCQTFILELSDKVPMIFVAFISRFASEFLSTNPSESILKSDELIRE